LILKYAGDKGLLDIILIIGTLAAQILRIGEKCLVKKFKIFCHQTIFLALNDKRITVMLI